MAEAVVETDAKRVEAKPEREFFISMLTRDIELIPAVLDLVDNSVDGAQSNKGDAGNLASFWIKVYADKDRFEIVDNCGGIEASHAREYAFRFGRPSDAPRNPGELGQFGVGMKRALFKLGSKFVVQSTARQSSFRLPVDVPVWAADPSPDWKFEFAEVEEAQSNAVEDCGTTITVSDLHPQVSHDFSTTDTLSRLRANLQLRHQAAVRNGLEIQLNEERIEPVSRELLLGEEFQPLHWLTSFEADGDAYELRVAAGIARDDDEEVDLEAPEESLALNKAGWYVFFNDRLLLAGDKTPLTGWGSATAAYHPQFRQFRGFIDLTSPNPGSMPWNTTKTGVDEDSKAFRVVQAEMFKALKSTMTVMNRVKNELAGDQDPSELISAIRQARMTVIEELPVRDRFLVPARPTVRNDRKNIRYSVSLQDFEKVAEELGTTQPPEVGRHTFAHYLNTQVTAPTR